MSRAVGLSVSRTLIGSRRSSSGCAGPAPDAVSPATRPASSSGNNRVAKPGMGTFREDNCRPRVGPDTLGQARTSWGRPGQARASNGPRSRQISFEARRGAVTDSRPRQTSISRRDRRRQASDPPITAEAPSMAHVVGSGTAETVMRSSRMLPPTAKERL